VKHHTLSYAKTLVAAVFAGLGIFIVSRMIESNTHGILWALLIAVRWGVLLTAAGVVIGGLIVSYRDRRQATGRRDLFEEMNESRSAKALTTASMRQQMGLRLRRAMRGMLRGRWLLVGDAVEIRSLDEILKTLDSAGCLDGLPFMPEMEGFCRQQAVVFRCVDKIYDYGRTSTLKRLKDSVLLAGLRCNGSAHGGCQASCYLIWKTAWLRLAAADERSLGSLDAAPCIDAASPLIRRESPPTNGRYSCQYTQLGPASIPMSTWDVRQDLRPALAGNVTLGAFCIALLTRLFNAAQTARGGAPYPGWTRVSSPSSGPTGRALAPGETVQVLPIEHIAATLNRKGRHRGLWFDRDMIRHCRQRYTVLGRVERIIDSVTGHMLQMATPCLVLDGVEATGEFLRLCAQHEYPFWREQWLTRETTSTS
jgi:hypothetical protein